ncbi:MAG TPA: glycosyltransferase [Verrucomicrobiota bacterium]|nr:glycosyltransferase [Verrucomicrobiota bacterium]HNT13858.1 glycosyltransferase [Verrucomicrobiota bacterium]
MAYYAATLLEIGGGLEKYFIESAHDLAALPGMQVDVLTMDDAFNLKYGRLHNFYFAKKFDPRLLYRESEASIRAKLGRARYLKSATFKELAGRMNEYDVVYSRNDITEPFFFKFVMGYRRLPPIIFGCHIPHVYLIARQLHAKAHNWLFTSWFYNWLASGVAGFHVINNYTHDFLQRQFPGRPIAKIYYPFDFDAFAAQAAQHPFPGKFATEKFNIVWVGRLVEQKGVGDLVRVVDRVNQTHGDRIAWHICGDGELKPLVESCQARWPNVKWWGHVANQQMASAYQQAQLFITTAHWETYPYNVLESQALHLPVVAFDIPGCSDMIENGTNGYVVSSLDQFVERVRSFAEGHRLPPEAATYLRQKINRERIYADLVAFFDRCRQTRAPRKPLSKS